MGEVRKQVKSWISHHLSLLLPRNCISGDLIGKPTGQVSSQLTEEASLGTGMEQAGDQRSEEGARVLTQRLPAMPSEPVTWHLSSLDILLFLWKMRG